MKPIHPSKNETVQFSSTQMCLLFLATFGIGYALVKSYKVAAFENSSIILICAGVAVIAGICRRVYAQK
ncbi:hypothetical protein [Flavobacterium sp.]|uniref:hypothetical protein n=1 Tax=Flavobacterium sp. TaxID=239 RepID=UPI0039E27AAB